MLYRLILKLRHRAFDKGHRKSSKGAIPTICIGNVTVGGTGKTPHTELCLRLLEGSEGVSVLSRGYGRKSKGFQIVSDACEQKVNNANLVAQFGDEPLQIARKFPHRQVAVDKDRLHGCEELKKLGAKLAILDDSFQHRKLRADLNIVLVNYSRPVFQDSLLPFGRLRDLPERIFKADIIIVSKCPEDISESEKADFAKKLKLKDYSALSSSAVTPDGKTVNLLFSYIHYLEPKMVFPEGDHRFTYGHRVMYMSGIAKDRRLHDRLMCKYQILKSFEFSDHHNFRKSELSKIEKALKKAKSCALATTEKDAQRLLCVKDISPYIKERLFMVPIEARMTSESELQVLAGALNQL